MDDLYCIISSLTNKEKRIVAKYLESFSVSDKKLKLFQLLIKYKTLDEENIGRKLYKEEYTESRIKKLKQRLQVDIENIMLFAIHNNDDPVLYNKNKNNTISLLLLAQVYLQKNLTHEAQKKLKKSIQLIRKHNFIFLESIYYQIHCEYLKRKGSKHLEENLGNSIKVLSEIQYIQSLKIRNIKLFEKDSLFPSKIDFSLQVFEKCPYSVVYKKLTKLKQQMHSMNLIEARDLQLELSEDIINYDVKLPDSIKAEIQIQFIKLNLLDKKFAENKELFNHIEDNNLSDDLKHKVLKLKFLNNFLLNDLESCNHLVLRFFFEISSAKDFDNELINTWKYFEICLVFVKGDYRKTLRLISQFPGRSSVSNEVQINIRILEIYTCLLLDKNDLVDFKLVSLKLALKKLENPRFLRYNFIFNLLELINKQHSQNIKKSSYSFIEKEILNQVAPKTDILGYELVAFEPVIEQLKSKLTS